MPGGWTRRRDPLPPDWKQRRKIVLERDGYQCTEVINGERCTALATDVHHVGHKHDHRIEMLRSICNPHHKAHTSRDANAAKPKRRREEAQHPAYSITPVE